MNIVYCCFPSLLGPQVLTALAATNFHFYLFGLIRLPKGPLDGFSISQQQLSAQILGSLPWARNKHDQGMP